jgi:hypothetical protein
VTTETHILLCQFLAIFCIAGRHGMADRHETQQADGQFAPHLHHLFPV